MENKTAKSTETKKSMKVLISETQRNEISIDQEIDRFKKHLFTPRNNNILFSGKYGSGKSFFLNRFKEEADICDKFYFITISPVNYVVSSNEDIFDLIKVDIIRTLHIDQKFIVDDITPKLPSYKLVVEYAKTKPLQVVNQLSTWLSKIALTVAANNNDPEVVATATAIGAISEGALASMKILTAFGKVEKKINSKFKPDNIVLGQYASSFIQNKSSFVENNLITEIITTVLADIRKVEGKEIILVIEDLDRLDPAHIFRILNIFSAHSFADSTNKFGFDKIMLVCDFNNIRNVYKHFYGADTEFFGYISKFYSISPYYFDNAETFALQLTGIMDIELSAINIKILAEILRWFIKDNKVNLRKVLVSNDIVLDSSQNIKYGTLSESDFTLLLRTNIVSSPEVYINPNDFSIVSILKILLAVFDNQENLREGLEFIGNRNYGVSQELQIEVYKLLAFNNHFMHNADNILGFFLRKDTDRNSYNTVLTVALKNRNFQVRPIWNQNNRYNSHTSVFERCEIIDLDPQKEIDSLTSKDLTQELIKSLNFYLNNKFIK